MNLSPLLSILGDVLSGAALALFVATLVVVGPTRLRGTVGTVRERVWDPSPYLAVLTVVLLVNNVALAGHVHIGDWAILSGYTLVHEFCRIGPHSFSGMQTAIGKDVPAYVTVSGSPAEAKTINTEGLRRRGFSDRAISQLRRAFKILYRQNLTLDIAVQRLETMLSDTPEVQVLIDSIRASERGIVR